MGKTKSAKRRGKRLVHHEGDPASIRRRRQRDDERIERRLRRQERDR